MAAKFLYFDGGSDNAMTFPVDRLLAIDQLDNTSILMTFEHALGTSSSNTKVDLTVTAGTEKAVMQSISEAIAFSKDQFVVIADSVNSVFIDNNISAVSVDDSGATNNGLTAGTGITSGTGTVYHSWIEKMGNVIKTSIFIDLTGLDSSASGDVIGKAATANSHIGQYTTAVSGTLFAGSMTCLETPAGGDADIDLHSVDEATLAEDAAISTGTNGVTLQAVDVDFSGTQNGPISLANLPTANQYLYLVDGEGTNGTYTAGKLLIELYGTE